MSPNPALPGTKASRICARSSSPLTSCAIGAALMDFRAARAPFLKAMATERNPSLRPTFGYALGLLGDRASLDVIEELVLDGKSSQTRIQGIRSLTAIRDIASVDILVKLLNRPRVNDITLAAALHGAGQIAEKSNLPGLEPLARDWNYVLPFEVINSAILR